MSGGATAGPSTPGATVHNSEPAPIYEDLPMKEAKERWVEPQEREYLVRLLKRFEGDLDRAADSAGMHRKSLERYLRKHGIRARGMAEGDE
jgi:DNA-binding NtrC family response regulator